MARAAEAFLVKRAHREVRAWQRRLIGRTIVKIQTDFRSDDTIALAVTLDDGTEFLGPSIAEFNDDTGRMEVL